jgi:hypothetical protein
VFLLPEQAKRLVEVCHERRSLSMNRSKAPMDLNLRTNTDTSYPQDIVPIYFIHTPEMPFCPLPGCECHTNQQEIAKLLEQVKEGILTLCEAVLFVDGRTV